MRVLLLHAFPVDAEMLRGQDLVLEGRNAAAPSLYGRGSSFDEIAASLLAEFEGDLCLVGASFGGGCAFAMARQAPEVVRGILLAGAHAGPDQQLEQTANDPVSERQTLKRQTSVAHRPTLPARTTPSNSSLSTRARPRRNRRTSCGTHRLSQPPFGGAAAPARLCS